MIARNGIIEGIEFCPSPNFDNRPKNEEIDLIVIHAISLPPKNYDTQLIRDFFSNKLNPQRDHFLESIAGLKVSSHFLVTRHGELLQFVSMEKRAWHAGVSEIKERKNCNDFSIGVELEGCDEELFEISQYECLIELLKFLIIEYKISPNNIVGHSEIAPGRKTDPGPNFDWNLVKSAL